MIAFSLRTSMKMIFTWCGLPIRALPSSVKDAFWSDTDAFWYWKPLTLIPVLKFKHSTPSLTWKKKLRKEHTPHYKLLCGYMKQIITKQSLKHRENVDKVIPVSFVCFCVYFPLPLTSCMCGKPVLPPCSLTVVIIFEGLQTGVLSIQSCHIKQQAKPCSKFF